MPCVHCGGLGSHAEDCPTARMLGELRKAREALMAMARATTAGEPGRAALPVVSDPLLPVPKPRGEA